MMAPGRRARAGREGGGGPSACSDAGPRLEEFEDPNRSGRAPLRKVAEEKLPLTPLRYEVAVTPKGFWGK